MKKYLIAITIILGAASSVSFGSEAGLKYNKNLADIFMKQGYALRDKGLYTEAESSYQKAIQVDPTHRKAWISLIILYKELGMNQKAKEITPITKKIIRFNNHLKQGQALTKAGDLNQALQEFNQALSLDLESTAEKALMNLQRCYEALGDSNKALDCQQALSDINQKKAPRIFFHQGKFIITNATTPYQENKPFNLPENIQVIIKNNSLTILKGVAKIYFTNGLTINTTQGDTITVKKMSVRSVNLSLSRDRQELTLKISVNNTNGEITQIVTDPELGEIEIVTNNPMISTADVASKIEVLFFQETQTPIDEPIEEIQEATPFLPD